MIPIQDLLDRIRWDPEFGSGELVIGYYDRVEREIICVPFREIAFPKDGPGVFELIDHQGQMHTIPLHRVSSVGHAFYAQHYDVSRWWRISLSLYAKMLGNEKLLPNLPSCQS